MKLIPNKLDPRRRYAGLTAFGQAVRRFINFANTPDALHELGLGLCVAGIIILAIRQMIGV